MSIVTKAAFAVELGVTKGRVSQYLKGGMPVRDDGKVDRVEALNWLNAKRLNLMPGTKGLNHAAAAVKASKPPTGKPRETSPKPRETSLDETTFETERTRKLKLENDETERQLIRIEDAVAAIDAIVGLIPAELSAVPARVTDDIALRRKIEDAIDNALNALSKRCFRAVADLEAGRDALGEAAPDDADGLGEEE